MSVRVATALLATALVAGCGGNSASDGGTDAAPDAGVCVWPNQDGGTIQCPADGKTVCPAGDGCNTCRCFTDGYTCTTLKCP